MGSRQDTGGMQLEDTTCSSWTASAYQTVQEIEAVLQADKDDVQPFDDAPNYQVLCGSARAACSQAEGSICSSASLQDASLHGKDLECLCQLSTATLQLSSAICCDPEVALSLISSGSHAAALDQLKGAVKSLTNLWASCMAVLQQQDMQQHAQHEGAGVAGPGPAAGSQQAWQGMMPSLAASLKHLLHMSVTSAEFVCSSSSSSSSQQVPREMCSMSALNLSWANLTRLLVAIPEAVRMQVLEVQDLLHALQCALQQLSTAVLELPVQPRERQEVLVRFWLQSVSRLTSAAWEAAAQQALLPLLQVTLEVYDAVAQQRQEFAAVQDILQQLLQPRLLACLSSFLSSSTDPTAIQAKLDILLQPTTTPAHTSQQQGQHQQQRLKAHVMVVLDLLQSVLSGWPCEVIASSCTQLLTWTIITTGRELCLSLLAGSGPAAAASGDGGSEESGAVAAALELMQGVLHGCLVGVVAAWAELQELQQQPAERQQQQQQQQQVVLDLLAAVNRLALSTHPLVSFLARQLVADMVGVMGASDFTAQQLSLLHKLLSLSTAAAAVPGASWETRQGVESVLDLLAAVLQACDEAYAVEWLKGHVLPGLASNSSSSVWLDAGACALFVHECGLLQRLVSTAPQLIPVSTVQMQECWTQLWSTAQQVAELLEPQQPSNASAVSQKQAESLLLLHHLTWLLSAMHAALGLYGLLDAAAARELKQGSVPLALDILNAVSASTAACSSVQPGNSSSTAAEAQFACTLAVLRLLASPGQLMVPGEQLQGLLVAMRGLAQQHEGLQAVLAGVLGNLGSAAGDELFQELFQHVLSSADWVVQNTSFESLLQLLRHGSLGTGIVKLLPPGMRSSATEATAEVINTVKAHLHRQADPQAQASFSQHYPDLAAQHMKQLSAKVNAHSNGTASSNTCPHDAQSIRKQLQSMEVLLAACGSAAASGSEAADGRGLLSPGRMGNEAAAATYPDGVGGAQSLLAQASTASKSLQAAEQALCLAESDVRLLLSAASAAARDHALGAEGILLVSKQGTSLMGNIASMISRLRALQDDLSTLRR